MPFYDVHVHVTGDFAKEVEADSPEAAEGKVRGEITPGDILDDITVSSISIDAVELVDE